MAEGEETTVPKPEAPPARVVRAPVVTRRVAIVAGGGIAALLLLGILVPRLYRALTTVSTDDAYVSGHVTFVAARVPGQVARVLVDDNNRVHKGDPLVVLDKEPYQVQVDVAQAAVDAAQSDLIAARAEALATAAKMRSLRFNLDHAIEHID